jgi:nucleotide-binding universal stress UspA family protein
VGRERAAYAKSVTGATRPRSLDASPGVAVQGADDTLAALAAGQVETLLITGTAHGERMLAEALAGWSEKYPEVPVHRMVRHSLDPAVTLAEASRSAQLVVVGAARRRERGRLVLGSVHQTLTDHAGCPVAVVPTDVASAA